MFVSVSDERSYAASDGAYVEYGDIASGSGVSERLSHFIDPIDPDAEGLEAYRVRLPESEEELVEVLSGLLLY